MTEPIAIVGLACEYPGAHSPSELWDTVLAKRRWFRNFPLERLSPEYWDTSGRKPDTSIICRGAFLEGYAFPLEKYLLGKNDFDSADFAQWLALDCADRALADAGHADNPVPSNRTRVLVGNTLSGETSRAELLRLRWPYVRKTLEESGLRCTDAEWSHHEKSFKARLTPINDKTLAGALPNVIAGRIANQLDLLGGAFSVDGACASSLLAVAQGCSALDAGDADCCLVGGVDASMDPLELVGFSMAGAFAKEEMLVFDQNSRGFLPGEGCGFAVLMRHGDAVAAGRRIYAVIRGWGITSDGRHNLVSPSPDGQKRALAAAYARAGYDIGTVSFFEAHGTGTEVGDKVEVGSLLDALSASAARAGPPAALGSVKANIGHTKAAAGIAGLIKAAWALNSRVIPPTTGCRSPLKALDEASHLLRVPVQPEGWRHGTPMRAGVSAFGFGGINVHVTLEEPPKVEPQVLSIVDRRPAHQQDDELFVFDGVDWSELRRQVKRVADYTHILADAQFAGVAAATAEVLGRHPCRAAVIASTPDELKLRLQILLEAMENQPPESEPSPFIFLNRADTVAPLGFLIPGQGGRDPGVGALWDRFFPAESSTSPELVTAEWTQAHHVESSAKLAELLAAFGIRPSACVGHSLGEISALHVSGALSREEAVKLARDRGRLMDQTPSVRGGMVVVRAPSSKVREFINGDVAAISAINSPAQTVVSGTPDALDVICRRAAEQGCATAPMKNISIAFHSMLMEPLTERFALRLSETNFGIARIPLFSTVTGAAVGNQTDFRSLLAHQLTSPVLFSSAFTAAAAEHIPQWIELGSGSVLSSLAAESLPQNNRCSFDSVESGSDSLRPLLRVLALAFTQGHDLNLKPLYNDRLVLPHNLDWQPCFLTNPCERPRPDLLAPSGDVEPAAISVRGSTPVEIVRALIAEQKGSGITIAQIQPHHRLGLDLAVDSLSLTTLRVNAERAFGTRPNLSPSSDLTVAEFASAFTANAPPESLTLSDTLVPWVRAFDVAWVPESVPESNLASDTSGAKVWHTIGLSLDVADQLPAAPAGSLLVNVPDQPDESFLNELLTALKTVPDYAVVVFLDAAGLLSGFARTLCLERPRLRVLILRCDGPARSSPSFLTAEIANLQRFAEVRYDAQHQRLVPRWKVLPANHEDTTPGLTSTDVILVTGGAQGITAECVLALAEKTGAKLALVGRSPPSAENVARTLSRMACTGVTHRYYSTDITNRGAILELVSNIRRDLGPITGIIHGAGSQQLRPIQDLTAERIMDHCHTKVDGLGQLLSAIDSTPLKLLVAFGSIIARSGYVNSGAYAVANEALASLVANFSRQHPAIRCMTLDWSAWEEIGMGVTLGAISSLKAAGVDTIRTEQGIDAFIAAVRTPILGPRPILAGRIPAMPTAQFAAKLVTQLEGFSTILSHTPGVELVAEVALSTMAQAILVDHKPDGVPVVPGVFSLKLLERAALTVAKADNVSVIHNISFRSKIEIPVGHIQNVRAQVIRDQDGSIVARLAPSGASLQTPAVEASFVTVNPLPASEALTISASPLPTLSQDEGERAAHDLYEYILFHGPSFRVIHTYQSLSSQNAIFDIKGVTSGRDLSPHAEIVLRDAIIHGVQACIPQQPVLPVSIERIEIFRSAAPARIVANKVEADQTSHRYDLCVLDVQGRTTEIWTGLKLLPHGKPLSVDNLTTSLRAVASERSRVVAGVTDIVDLAISSQPVGRLLYTHEFLAWKDETNPFKNIYFSNFVKWQCRAFEALVGEISNRLSTADMKNLENPPHSVQCKYFRQVYARDRLRIEIRLLPASDGLACLRFDCLRQEVSGGATGLVAIGEHFIGIQAAKTLAHALGADTLLLDQTLLVQPPLKLDWIPPARRAYAKLVDVQLGDYDRNDQLPVHRVIRLQGKMRETFLEEHAPSVMGEMKAGFQLLTLSASHRLIRPVHLEDKLAVEMRILDLTDSRVTVRFDFLATTTGNPTQTRIGFGEQVVQSWRNDTAQSFPGVLAAALRAYI